MASLQFHFLCSTIVHVVFVHVMLRQITIGQPDASILSRVTDTNDLKYISRVINVLILPSAMGLIVT